MADLQPTTDAGARPASSAPVFRLIYRSRSTIAADAVQGELGQIFRVARANNAATSVTGALMQHGPWFAQVLEGPEDAVHRLFDRIKTDPRHDTVEVKEQSVVPERAFGRWAMAQVPEHGNVDVPQLATANGMAEGAAWKVSPGQEKVLSELRLLTRGYGKGY